MQRRLLVIALVFVAGFGVGYGITWLLVGSSGRDADRQVARSEATRPALAGPDASAPEPAPDAAAPDAAASAPDAGPAPAADAGVAADAAAPLDTAVAAAPEVVAEVAAAETEAPPKAAWEVCHLHACRVDFGKVTGGISIREGSLEHGQTVDWDKDFAKADKIGTLDAGSNVKVEVLAIALESGEPAAAYIVRKTKRGELKGVIALRVGDKALRLVPLDQ